MRDESQAIGGYLSRVPLARRERALASADPVHLPWIAASLRRLDDVLADLAP